MTQGWLFDSQFLRKHSCKVNFFAMSKSLSRPHIKVMAELCSSTDLSNANTIMRSFLYIPFLENTFFGWKAEPNINNASFSCSNSASKCSERLLNAGSLTGKTKFPVLSPAVVFLKDRFQDHSPQSIWLVPLVCFSKELLTWINSRYRGYFLITRGNGIQSSGQ